MATPTAASQDAFKYWVKQVFPEIYTEDIGFNDLIQKTYDYITYHRTGLTALSVQITSLANSIDTLRNYIYDYTTQGTASDDIDINTTENLRLLANDHNLKATKILNDLFFVFWNG